MDIKNQGRKRERSAGFILLQPDGDGDWRVLILRAAIWRGGKIAAYSKTWDVPKGHVNPGESDLEAALRETQEETQFEIDPAAMTWGKVTHTVAQKNKDVAVFVAEWRDAADPVFLPGEHGYPEHADFMWASWSHAYNNVYDAMKTGIIWAYTVSHNCSEQEAISKITAGV